MKFSRHITNFTVIFCILLSPLFASTYYIDNQNGNDQNTGTSPITPWKTITKINHSSFKPGDSILFKRGQIWREQLIVPSSGSPDSPITVGAYGNGDMPIISGADDITLDAYKWTVSVSGINEYYLESINGKNPQITEPQIIWMDQINLTKGDAGSLLDHEWDWTDNDNLGFNSVYLRDDSGDPDVSGILIEAGNRDIAIEIGDKSYITVEGLVLRQSDARWGGLVHIYDSHHIIFKNCTIHDAHYTPFYMFHSDAEPPEYNTIDSCTIYGCRRTDSPYGSVVKLHDCHYNTIKNCTIYESNNVTWSVVVFLYESSHNTIEHNDIYGSAGNLLYIRNNANFNLVIYNKIHDSMGGMGVQIRQNANGNKIFYNVIYNMKGGPAIQSDGDEPIDGTKIYNNTIFTTGNNHNGISIHNTNTSCEVKNNLIHVGEHSFALQVHENSIQGTTSDHNLFNNVTGVLIRWGDNEYHQTEFSDYQIDSGQDIHSANDNPWFIDSQQLNFHLRPTSFCIDAGIDVGISLDIDGMTVPQGKNVDLGAYEYESISPPKNLRVKD